MKRKLLPLVLALSLCGCGWFSGAFWPRVETCAPSPAALVSVVETILLTGDNIEANLEQAALQYGKVAVVCAVQAFVDSVGGKVGASQAELAAGARGKAFLMQHPVAQ